MILWAWQTGHTPWIRSFVSLGSLWLCCSCWPLASLQALASSCSPSCTLSLASLSHLLMWQAIVLQLRTSTSLLLPVQGTRAGCRMHPGVMLLIKALWCAYISGSAALNMLHLGFGVGAIITPSVVVAIDNLSLIYILYPALLHHRLSLNAVAGQYYAWSYF